jgi:hypothetical protein
VGDRVLWTSLDTKPTKDAPAIINIVNASVSFIAADPFSIRPRIILGLDINTI